MNFEQLCNALSTNDPKTTTVHRSSSFPTDWGNRLGNALIGNTHVNSVSLIISHGHIDAPTSPINESSISSLLQYFREGQAMRRVTLEGTTDVYIGLCLRALASNSNITHITLDTEAVPWIDLTFFIENAPALTYISIRLSSVNETVANALHCKRNIEEIFLRHCGDSPMTVDTTALCLLPSDRHIEAILRPTTVHVLEWERALRVFLRTDSPGVQYLRLCGELRLEATECLVTALSLPTISLQSLSLFCTLGKEAANLFTSYMQRSGAGGNILSYQLGIICDTLDPASLLQGACGLRSMLCFSICDEHIIGLWRALSDDRLKILLSTLECNGFESESVSDVACVSIPKLLYLRELRPLIKSSKECSMKLANAIWQNGSLQSCSESDHHPSGGWKYEELRVLELVCERNTKLPNLLVHLLTNSHISYRNKHDTRCGWPTMTVAMMETEQMEAGVSLCPSVFAVAQQSPRHAPNWILMGLLHLCISYIGPQCHL